ncbi:DUF1697 domain-containing protein [Celeribacter arenosi]|uniref:DUF1697 domain-containing protein n=1 Tax=Celeribacter arenosi TaxID=792649 RepID=A0ABP7K8L1_9RHOB
MGQTWIALLRGVNVGGHGKLPMAAFRQSLQSVGYGNVRTYVQSGNAVFESERDAGEISAQITGVLETDFGFSRPVFVMSPDALEMAIAANPFKAALAEPKSLHLFFCGGAVNFDVHGFAEICDQGEQFDFVKNVFYFYTTNGFGRSKASQKIEKFLQADVVTARNLNSCRNIATLAQG